ncbi:AraC family transcriptional regulator [Aureispira anguillae]|uniref:AraC family transcriptional regulator n=1 Tax=Aureispira anguillae TaxID=2864201 RepID=A0A915YGX1_9BACT|nr:AraC family transcriptional regulator [Aureispira anguillae]BDS12817.1 AraC family transcriptional regulator [Aureispira anguillae]
MLSQSPYFFRLVPVLDYIQDHYNRAILPQELEKISFYSYRNLQRIFKAIWGETIGAYQKRLRLENAAKLMHYSSKSLTDIAIEVGYADLQAFRKAFKNQYGIAPSQQRPKLMATLTQLKQTIEFPSAAIQQLNTLKVTLPAIHVVFRSYQGAYNNAQLEKEWEMLWEQNKNLNTTDEYGLVFDDIDITSPNICRYDACLAYNSQQDSANSPTKTIGGKNYLRFLHLGSYDTIEQTYAVIFGGWLLQNDYNFSTGPIIEHYYYNQHHTDQEEAFKTHIYIPF